MVIIERGDQTWGAHVPDLPGCVAVAETRAEVVGLIREATGLHIEALKSEGAPIPDSRSEVEMVEVGLSETAEHPANPVRRPLSCSCSPGVPYRTPTCSIPRP